MRVAALQHDIVWEDRDATLANLEPQVAAAAAAGAHLIVLTEMFATGFSMDTHHTAEPVDGPIVRWMAARAGQHGVRLAGSVALAGTGGGLPTNSLLVVGPGGVEHRYDKLHPFSYAGEHERFAAGDQPAVIADLDGVRVALTVCYDLRFADQYWAPAAAVDAYLVVANWPETRRHHWRTLLDARAIENQAYVVGVNRVGEGGGLVYTGDSRIVDPMGEVLASGAAGETMLLADLDPDVVNAIRARFPFMRDR
jgi:predicted amidohydrolase